MSRRTRRGDSTRPWAGLLVAAVLATALAGLYAGASLLPPAPAPPAEVISSARYQAIEALADEMDVLIARFERLADPTLDDEQTDAPAGGTGAQP